MIPTTMTQEEAKEYFRLWPTWRAKDGSGRITIVDPLAIWHDIASGNFFDRYDRVDNGHIPIGSWWKNKVSGVVVHITWIDTVTGAIGLFGLAGALGSSVCGGSDILLKNCERITPQNFKWYEPHARDVCVVCGKPTRNNCETKNSSCHRLILAVFGSEDRGNQAFRRRHQHSWAEFSKIDKQEADKAKAARDYAKITNVKVLEELIEFEKATLHAQGDIYCAVCNQHVAKPNHPHQVFCSGGCAKTAGDAYRTTLVKDFITADTISSGTDYKALEEQMLGRVIRGDYALRLAADRALRFLCGLNLDGHSIKDQREARDIVAELVKALRPGAEGK